MPGLYVHDLRRSFARRCEQRGVARSVAMKLSGHLTESIFARYSIVSESDLAEGAGRLDESTGTITGTMGKKRSTSSS